MALKTVVELLTMGACVGLSIMMALYAGMSWWGGKEGVVHLYFNLFGERLVESILFPVIALSGLATVFRAAWRRKYWQDK